jgi:hypothetical protein
MEIAVVSTVKFVAGLLAIEPEFLQELQFAHDRAANGAHGDINFFELVKGMLMVVAANYRLTCPND